MTRAQAIRQYSDAAEQMFRDTLERVIANCPELLPWDSKNIARDHISDMCAALFGETITSTLASEENPYTDYQENLDRERDRGMA